MEINDQIFPEIQKTVFLAHLPEFSAPCQNLIIQFQENGQTDGRREGWTDPIS